MQPPDHGGKPGNQVFRDKARSHSVRGFAMSKGGGGSGLGGRHPLGEEARDHSGKHIAGASGSKPRGSVGVDDRSSLRRGDNGIGAFVEDDSSR